MDHIIKTENSSRLFELSKSFVTAGVHSNFRYREPYPLYFSRAKGASVWDVDGNEYVDCLVGNGSCILGHGDEGVKEAVSAQLETGLTVGLESELSVDVARTLHKMIPSAEVVKFSNTGTEAVMHAFQIVRGFTGKRMIIKTEGAYHGWQDEIHVSFHPKLSTGKPRNCFFQPIPEAQGYPPSALDNVVVVPYNDAAAVEKYLSDNQNEVAAMIVEPVLFNSGCILPKPGYLRELREITEKHGVLLIFDEVITGFRLAPGGGQELYRVKPDLSVFGKAIANGFPLSAVVGNEEIMSVTMPKTGKVSFAGTFNSNQMSLAAAKACLSRLQDGKIQSNLAMSCKFLLEKFREIKEEMLVDANLQAMGGQFQVYFTKNENLTDYETAARSNSRHYATFCEVMLDSGILVHPSYLFHHGVTNSHNDQDLAKIVRGLQLGLKRVKEFANGVK